MSEEEEDEDEEAIWALVIEALIAPKAVARLAVCEDTEGIVLGAHRSRGLATVVAGGATTGITGAGAGAGAGVGTGAGAGVCMVCVACACATVNFLNFLFFFISKTMLQQNVFEWWIYIPKSCLLYTSDAADE